MSDPNHKVCTHDDFFNTVDFNEQKKTARMKEAGGKNWRKKVMVKGLATELDPEQQKFKIPDFGF